MLHVLYFTVSILYNFQPKVSAPPHMPRPSQHRAPMAPGGAAIAPPGTMGKYYYGRFIYNCNI